MRQEETTTEVHENWVALAYDCTEKLKNRYPKFSSSQIADKIGVAQSTFNRVEKRAGQPTLRTLTRLLSASGEAQTLGEVEKLLNGSSKEIAQNLSHVRDNKLLTGDLAEAFTCIEYRMVLLLASTNLGTTREEIKENHGTSGINVLEEMLRLKILEEKDGVIKSYVSDQKEPFVFDHQTAKEMLACCIREKYNPDYFGTGKNWLSFQTESVDVEKSMEAIRPILKKAYDEIEKVIRSPKYEGNGKIFIGMVGDSLTNESTTNKKEEMR